MQHGGLCFHKRFGVSATEPATHRHSLSFHGTREVVLGTYCVLGGVFNVCVSVFLALLLCIQEVSGRLGKVSWSQRKVSAPGGSVIPSGPCWAAGGARHGDSRMGRWGQTRGGARPALALSLTGSGQCPAAKGRGLAYAHKLISSASAWPPAQSGCLHCRP